MRAEAKRVFGKAKQTLCTYAVVSERLGLLRRRNISWSHLGSPPRFAGPAICINKMLTAVLTAR